MARSVDSGEQMIRDYFLQKVSTVQKFIGATGDLGMKWERSSQAEGTG